MSPEFLKTVLPILVIAVVLTLRLRSMRRLRPLNPAKLWILPAFLVALAGVTLWAHPLSVAGMGISIAACVVGGVVGWQRGRLIRIDRDPANGQLTQQASPAALILLVAIVALRFAARSYFGTTPDANGQMSEQALIATDALLLFAVGLIATTRIELALRARRILAGAEA